MTDEEILLMNDTELLERLHDVDIGRLDDQRKAAARALCPKHTTALEMKLQRSLQTRQFVSSSLKSLDDGLRGGLPCGTITEFVGPATVGKSQFCFSIAVLEAAPVAHGGYPENFCLLHEGAFRSGGKVIYFDTENKFSVRRMAQIIDHRWRGVGSEFAALKARILDNILIVRPENATQLTQHFQGLEASVAREAASLVIVDSIAAILRAEFGQEALLERQSFVGEQAARLKYIAHRFHIPILVTNQVTTPFDTAQAALMGDSSTVMYDGVVPALGTKWAHCVNTRLSLERVHGGTKRLATIRKSPHCPNAHVYYKISDVGIEPDN